MRYIKNKSIFKTFFSISKTIVVTFIIYAIMWTCINNKNLNKQKDEEEKVIVEERIATLNIKETANRINNTKIHKNLDWNLTLVNSENKLPDNYELNLANIDNNRKFDSRAIVQLKEMLSAMKRDGIRNVWVQSSYRSVEYQTEVYNEKMNEYISKGYDRETAMDLTEETINKPGHSEHNLGLAVDFNYVNLDFENTDAYHWLMENAQDYGFVLRYPSEKEQITKVRYEPWHWRYVGKDHATKMKALNMCLEEYVEYICV